MGRSLTKKQIAFIDAYLECRGKSEAYRRAYGGGKMTPRTIARRANDALNRPLVKAEIERREAAMREAVGRAEADSAIKASRIWAREDSVRALADVYAASAEAMRREILDEDGRIDHIEYNPPAAQAARQAVEALNKMMGYNEPDKSQMDASIVIELGEAEELAQ